MAFLLFLLVSQIGESCDLYQLMNTKYKVQLHGHMPGHMHGYSSYIGQLLCGYLIMTTPYKRTVTGILGYLHR